MRPRGEVNNDDDNEVKRLETEKRRCCCLSPLVSAVASRMSDACQWTGQRTLSSPASLYSSLCLRPRDSEVLLQPIVTAALFQLRGIRALFLTTELH